MSAAVVKMILLSRKKGIVILRMPAGAMAFLCMMLGIGFLLLRPINAELSLIITPSSSSRLEPLHG